MNKYIWCYEDHSFSRSLKFEAAELKIPTVTSEMIPNDKTGRLKTTLYHQNLSKNTAQGEQVFKYSRL